jgi:6-phosphofructokinase 2
MPQAVGQHAILSQGSDRMSAPRPIVTLTLNPAIDGFCEAEVVRPIHKVRTSAEEFHPGGGGVNVARVIRDLGGDALAIYLAGGITGLMLDGLIAGINLPARRIDIAGHTRIDQVVLERSTGLEYRFVAEGPKVTAAEFDRCRSVIAETVCDWLVLSGSLPPGLPETSYAQLVATASERGVRCVVDTSGPALRSAVDHGGLTLVKPSQGEFESLVGRKLPDVDSLGREAQALAMSKKVSLVAVTLGRDGALLATADGVLQFRAPPVVGRSAVGAGDSFVAAMVLSLALGQAPEEAFRRGMAAGSAAVLRHGPYLCDPADVERLYREIA